MRKTNKTTPHQISSSVAKRHGPSGTRTTRITEEEYTFEFLAAAGPEAATFAPNVIPPKLYQMNSPRTVPTKTYSPNHVQQTESSSRNASDVNQNSQQHVLRRVPAMHPLSTRASETPDKKTIRSNRIKLWRGNIHGHFIRQLHQLQPASSSSNTESAEQYEDPENEDDVSCIGTDYTTFSVIYREKDRYAMPSLQPSNKIAEYMDSRSEAESRDRELDPSEY